MISIFSTDQINILPEKELDPVYDSSLEMMKIAMRGITDLFLEPGYIEIEFNDIRSILANAGIGFVITGLAPAKLEAPRALEQALLFPLVDVFTIQGLKKIVMTISTGVDISLDEMAEVSDVINQELADDAEFVWGQSHDPDLNDMIRITLLLFPNNKSGYSH